MPPIIAVIVEVLVVYGGLSFAAASIIAKTCSIHCHWSWICEIIRARRS